MCAGFHEDVVNGQEGRDRPDLIRDGCAALRLVEERTRDVATVTELSFFVRPTG
jgi:hypothetical protein